MQANAKIEDRLKEDLRNKECIRMLTSCFANRGSSQVLYLAYITTFPTYPTLEWKLLKRLDYKFYQFQ